MKYAVIRTGGKQYRVSEGDVVRIEKLTGEVGEKITLADVLLVAGDGEAKIGAPLVANARVTGEIVDQTAREEDHRLQKETTQELQSPSGPPAVSNGAEDYRYRSVAEGAG